MAHPDPQRSGSEKGQREHTGPNSEATDAGVQRHAQNLHGGGPTPGQGGGGGGGDRADARSAADTRVGDIDERPGLVAPGERADLDGPLPDRGLDRDSGAGAAGGRDTSGGTRSGAGGFGIGSGADGGRGREGSPGGSGRQER